MIGNTLENTPLKIAIVAGERSGDELGAPLMKSLKSINPSIEFVGVGGSKMTSEGLESYFDMSEDKPPLKKRTTAIKRSPKGRCQ